MPNRSIRKACEHCGRVWQASSSKVRTCSPKCRAQLREAEKPTRGNQIREYPDNIVSQVKELYSAGATVREIQQAIGPGYRAQTLVERFVEVRRRAVPRQQDGNRNPNWRGNDAGYQALHLRVEAARGKPCRCACCDTTDNAARYEWANLTGHYEDIHDYVRLCVSCHRRLDAARRAATGQRTAPPKGGEANV